MVVFTVAKELFKVGIRLATRYYGAESKAFSKLYRGFPQSKQIGRGVRHGLVAGSIAGSFINDADDSPGNGIQKQIPKQTTARKPYKTRYRQTRRSSNRYGKCYKPDFRSKFSRFSKYS